MNRKLHLTTTLALGSLLVAAVFGPQKSNAQGLVRSYATRQAIAIGGISVTTTDSAANAVDANPLTASHLNLAVGVGGSMTQFLDFNPSSSATTSYATTIAANTPITIKFDLPSGLVSALNNIEIQAITGLSYGGALTGWTATNVGTAYSGSTLVGLISGAGSVEYTITPTAAFQGIRIKVSGLVSAAVGISVYDAYIKTSTTSAVCNSTIDLLSGVRAGATAGIANATGGVTNSGNAIDNSSTTYSTLNTGAQVLSNVYETAIFNSPSKVGDSLLLTIQDASLNLLNLSALAGMQINLYNGSNGTPVQTFTNGSPLLRLSVLDTASAMEQLSFVPTAVFDRVELQLGGVAAALQSIRWYNVTRKNAGVTLTTAQKDVYVYAGQNFTLAATGVATGDSVKYYNALTGGSVVANVIASTMGQAGTTLSYYAGTTRNGCSESSDRSLINVHVIPFVTTTPTTGNIGSPYSSSVAVSPQNSPSGFPLTPVYHYTTTSTMPPGLTLNANTGAITGNPTASGTYPLVVTVTDQANNVPVGTFTYNLLVNSVPLAANLLSFEGNTQAGVVTLTWTIAAQALNKSYDVERSTDGKTFKTIGAITSVTETQNYQYVDKAAANGINFYRLKVIESNESSEYSKTVAINVNQIASISIYPNPVEGNVLFVKSQNVKSIQVANSVGQIIKVPVTYGSDLTQIQMGSLAKGVYFLKVINDNETPINFTFIVK